MAGLAIVHSQNNSLNISHLRNTLNYISLLIEKSGFANTMRQISTKIMYV